MKGPPDRGVPPLRAGARLPIELTSSGPLYEGHFPGLPILPGIGLLDLALRALASAGASSPLREIPSLRLRRLVAPGDVLELHVQDLAPDGRVRIEVRRAAEVVANGVVLLGAPHPSEALATLSGAPRRPSGFPDLDDLLPHRPPMRFVDWIERAAEDAVVCAARVPELCAFNSEGFAPALVALEMAAQSAAVFEALRRSHESSEAGSRIGYLVGARDVRFARARVPAGETLLAEVRVSGIALPLSTYLFDVSHEGQIVASGTVSTWLTGR